MKSKILNDEIFKALMPVFKKHEVFVVGGFLRDLFFNKCSFDRDLIVCDVNPSILAEEISQRFGGTIVLLDKENAIYRVVLKDKKNYFDITKPLENDIIKDIKRRDFTINSLLFDLNKEEFFDPFNFQNDIKNKIIKTCALKNFQDDPLRLLRVYRFKSLLGFEISEDIIDFIKKNANLINNVAHERVNYEIIKMFEGNFLVETLLDMQKTGFLTVIFPVLKDVEKIPPNSHHHLPLIFHSIETVKNIRAKKPLLKLSALLHDIGKPATWTIESDTGRHRFIGHEKIGAEVAKKIFEDLKFSKKQTNYMVKMIENHLYPSILMGAQDKTERAMVRFVKKMEPDVEDVVELARADRLSALGEAVTSGMVEDNLKNLSELLEFYKKIKPTLVDLPKLLNGCEIMKFKNMPAGKSLGIIIEALKEAQLMGLVKTKEDAIDFVREYNLPS